MAARKTAILDAAIAVIARRGVRGLRVEEVAADAGVDISLVSSTLVAAAVYALADRS